MREQTSSFDDVEKRLSIFIGLGAFLFNALICLIVGASMETYLIQGTVLALGFGILGYFYSHWLSEMVRKHTPQETADNESVEFRRVDAEQIAEQVVSASEIPDTVIQEDAGDGAEFYELPELGDAGVPAPPSPTSFEAPEPNLRAQSAPSQTPEDQYQDTGVDLPPPSVPAGA